MSDSDLDEDNDIRYGTPLDPYDEDEVPSKRKYQEPADQYAVDAHGRRRFHGAFTGGFSAGFGNTAGSQEGWIPATFKSSRMEKAQLSSQKPEDFMDEEDRSEFGIAPKQVQTSSEFSGQKRQRARGFNDGPIPGEPVLEQLLKPIHETAAVRMLKAMGWRCGQGTGDRLPRRSKRAAKDRHKVYGCYMPEDMRPKEESNNEDSSDSEIDFDTLYAPDDYEPYMLSHKSDRFGLGYKGLSRHSVLGNLVGEYGSDDKRSRLVLKEKGKKVSIRGQAFGVGAFEADDEDIYATEDMTHYDFATGPAASTEKPKLANKPSNVLQGFTPSSKPFPSVASYPPPALPKNYIPVAVKNKPSIMSIAAPHRDMGLGRHELTSLARGLMLGEMPPMQNTIKTPQPTTPTVPSTQSTASLTQPTIPTTQPAVPTTQPTTPIGQKEDILSKIMGRNLDFVSTKNVSSSAPDFISIKDSGKELTNVFKPFASNPKKQARYEKYCANGMFESDGDMDRLTEWEREREIVEFEQAAKLYRPLSGIMGDRFTHASQPDDAINPLTAVAKSNTNYGLATPEQIQAAEKGVYGVLTRTKVAWRPDTIVCKRFNVPEPNVTRLEPKKDDRPNISYSVFSYMESSIHDKNSFTKEQGQFSGSKSQREHNVPHKQATSPETSTNDPGITKSLDQNTTTNNNRTGQQHIPSMRMTVAELFMKESEDIKDQGKEVTEAIEKFDKMDLYKSIFLSDSEDETQDKQTEVSDFVDVPKNVARNTSPPRGIFANIDFDEINSWKRPEPTEKTENIEPEMLSKESNNDSHKTNDSGMEYGPKIPENLKKRLESDHNESANDVQVIESSSDDSWVDVKAVKVKKSKKKSKKHKLKHKKSKHKKKDR